MDTASFANSAILGIGAGGIFAALDYAYFKIIRKHYKPEPVISDCRYLHDVAAAERTIYRKVVSPSAIEHLALCPKYKILPGPERWMVVRTPESESRIEYLCEHVWEVEQPNSVSTAVGVCAKCGIKKAEAYRLPSHRDETNRRWSA